MNHKDSVKRFAEEEANDSRNGRKDGCTARNKITLIDLETLEGIAKWEELNNNPDKYTIIEDRNITAAQKIRKMLAYREYTKKPVKENENFDWDKALDDI